MGRPPKRNDILQTAGQLFLSDGYQGVSVDRIAAAVPVSKPTLYAHFKDKRELFMAVVEERCEIVLESIKASHSPKGSPEKNLEEFATHLLALLLSKEALQFNRMIIGESENFPEVAHMFYETGPKPMCAFLAAYLQTLKDEGSLHIEDVDFSAGTFLSILKGYTHMRCLLGLQKDISPDEQKTIVRRTVQIFLNGHRPRA